MINKKNMVNIYRIGILGNALTFVFLFIMKEKIVDYIYLFAIITSFISMLYWQPYKNIVYTLNGDEEFKKFNVYNSIVGSIISILSTIGMGYLIVKLSYMYVFSIIFIISFVAFLITFKFKDLELKVDKFKNKNVKELLKDKKAKSIYKIVYYEGIGNCGALNTAIQLIIFIQIGSEFGLGNWNALFSILGIITALIVKKYLKKENYIKSYIISATSIIVSLIPLIISTSFSYFIIYNIVFNIAYQITSILMNSSIFNVKEIKILNDCRLEYTFLQESIHALGKVTGEAILLIVVIFAYSLQSLQIMVVLFSATILLQAIEYRKFTNLKKNKNILSK